jgi:nucleotide-binding universal stress UspA family protein
MYTRILVPVDGSPTAQRGLEEAIGLAASSKARLVALHVVNDVALLLDGAGMSDTSRWHDANLKRGQELVDAAAKAAAQKGVECDPVVLDAKADATADAICGEAVRRECDLIVMGTHGRRGLRRLTLGSDAELVVRATPVPVLLVRHEDSQATT